MLPVQHTEDPVAGTRTPHVSSLHRQRVTESNKIQIEKKWEVELEVELLMRTNADSSKEPNNFYLNSYFVVSNENIAQLEFLYVYVVQINYVSFFQPNRFETPKTKHNATLE